MVTAEHLLKHLRFRHHPAAYGDVARLAPLVEAWDDLVALARERRLRAGIGLVLEGAARELGAPVPQEASEALVAGMWARSKAYGAVRPGALLERGAPEGGAAGRSPAPLAADRLARRGGGPPRRPVAPGAIRRGSRPVEGGSGEDAAAGRRGPEGGVRRSLVTVRLWLRYAGDVLRWVVGRGRSPTSPDQDVI